MGSGALGRLKGDVSLISFTWHLTLAVFLVRKGTGVPFLGNGDSKFTLLGSGTYSVVGSHHQTLSKCRPRGALLDNGRLWSQHMSR